jgi:Rieske Fe-S protein
VSNEETNQSESSTTPGPTKPVSRRRLLDVLLGTSFVAWFASVCYPTVRYLMPVEGAEAKVTSVKVGMKGDMEPNSGKIFRMGNKPGLLIRTPAGEFRAFIAICTHLDCTVQYKEDEGVIWCACHNGRYNLQGINISGPPPRPLDPLDVTLKGDEIYVSLPA